MNPEKLAAAFNEWLRRYTEEPEAFEHEWQAVHTFLEEQSSGKTPSYGLAAATYLLELIDKINEKENAISE